MSLTNLISAVLKFVRRFSMTMFIIDFSGWQCVIIDTYPCVLSVWFHFYHSKENKYWDRNYTIHILLVLFQFGCFVAIVFLYEFFTKEQQYLKYVTVSLNNAQHWMPAWRAEVLNDFGIWFINRRFLNSSLPRHAS